MSIKQLRDVVTRNKFVILDTETTGLDGDAQACQIAVIDQDGRVLIDTLLKPTIPIPDDAIAIHGITNEMVAAAPGIQSIGRQLLEALRGRDLIIYNADYDMRILDTSIMASGDEELIALWSLMHRTDDGTETHCAMRLYARFWGAWDEYHQSYTWQRLSAACGQQGIPVVNAHNALGDCQMTLALIRKICAGTDPVGVREE